MIQSDVGYIFYFMGRRAPGPTSMQEGFNCWPLAENGDFVQNLCGTTLLLYSKSGMISKSMLSTEHGSIYIRTVFIALLVETNTAV